MLSKHPSLSNAYTSHIFQKEENHNRQLLCDHQGNNVCEKFMGSFLTSFLERSIFGFIIIRPVPEFNFGFSNIWELSTHLLLHSHNLKGHIEL